MGCLEKQLSTSCMLSSLKAKRFCKLHAHFVTYNLVELQYLVHVDKFEYTDTEIYIYKCVRLVRPRDRIVRHITIVNLVEVCIMFMACNVIHVLTGAPELRPNNAGSREAERPDTNNKGCTDSCR